MAVLLAGCGQEETILPEGDGTALRVTSRIEEASLTKAVDKAWTAGDAIGIYQLNDGTVEIANRKYETAKGDGDFTPAEGAIYLPVDGTGRDFAAYYPWNAGLGESGTYTADLTAQANQEAIDLMVAEPVTGISKTNETANLKFHHKLSKLRLTVKNGEGLASADLAGLTVRITAQKTACTYNILTNTLTPTAEATVAITLKTTEDGTFAEGIVCPNESVDGMELTFTVKGETYAWPLNSSTTTTKFEAGKKYLYNITVNRIGLVVTSEITDWIAGNGESGENGSAE